jgi:hypothetical protein
VDWTIPSSGGIVTDTMSNQRRAFMEDDIYTASKEQLREKLVFEQQFFHPSSS